MATRVLIVDDDPTVRDLLASFLQTQGYAPLLASGGADALAVLDRLQPPPAILLLDLVMPELDGYAVLAALRQRGQEALPVLVFSAHRPDAMLLAALDGTHRDFIAKPVDRDELHVRLQRLLRHAPSPAPSSPHPALHVQALGSLRVYRGETLLLDERWRNKLAKNLFKLLLGAHGQRMSKDTLVEALWPEADPDSALNRLRVTVHDLRRKLEGRDGDGARCGGLRLIVQQEGAYVFDPDHLCWTDVEAFEEALRQGHLLAQEEQDAEALVAYRQAEALYAGDYLREDPYAEWGLATRERLREAYLGLLAAMGKLHAQQGDIDAAVARCRQILRLEPWREETYRRLMRYLVAAGRRGEALRVFEECARALAAEGVEPAGATRRLRERLAAGGADGVPHDPKAPASGETGVRGVIAS